MKKLFLALLAPFLVAILYVVVTSFADADWADKNEWPIGLIAWAAMAAVTQFITRPRLGGKWLTYIVWYAFCFAVVLLQIWGNG